MTTARGKGFDVRIDAKAIAKALEQIPTEYQRRQGMMLEQVMDGIIANIRRRRIWPREKKGTLKEGLWRGRPKLGSHASIDGGWSGVGAAFGPGHEWGFKKSKWKIAPVNTRTSTRDSSKRIGKPIKALRFVVGGKVMYSRGHEVSAPSKLRPHWAPALKAYPVEARMGKEINRAVRKVGL